MKLSNAKPTLHLYYGSSDDSFCLQGVDSPKAVHNFIHSEKVEKLAYICSVLKKHYRYYHYCHHCLFARTNLIPVNCVINVLINFPTSPISLFSLQAYKANPVCYFFVSESIHASVSRILFYVGTNSFWLNKNYTFLLYLTF